MAKKRSPSATMSNSRLSKRRRCGRCYFDADGFDENLVREILSRLLVPDLLAAKHCCRSWNDISTCNEFHALYDHKSNNDAMVIGLNSSTNSFPFFQISVKGGNYMRQWDFALDRQIVGENSEWMLVGSYKSLLLFKEKEVIKFCVANPLTRKCRLIPEPPIDKAKTWRMRSVHMIVSGVDKSLKLLVFAVTLRSRVLAGPCFSMAYDYLTNGWKVCQLSEISGYCSEFENDPEGICFSGKNAIHIRDSSFFSYDIENSFLAKQTIKFDGSVPDNYRFRAHGPGIFEYQNNMYLLDAWRPHNNSMGKMSKIMIWKADSTGDDKWKRFMKIDLLREFGSSISRESVVCYDQERYISVFPRDGPRMILVDLHSKNFRILGVNPVTVTWNTNSCLSRGDLRAFPIKPSFNCFLK